MSIDKLHIIFIITAVRLHPVEEALGHCDGSQTRVADGPDPRARGLPEAFQQVQGGDGGAAHRETLTSVAKREKNHPADYFC